MAEQNKRYHWLKLQNTYFNQLEQKKMRKQENGKDMQIIYLRMMLLSLDKGGYIYHQGVYDTLEEELAEEFAEDVSLVKETIQYLSDNNMISLDEESNCFLPQALECTGSECYSAERMRRLRKKKASQCDNGVTERDADVISCDEEIELEKELELEKEIEPAAPVFDDDDEGMDAMEAMRIWKEQERKRKNIDYQRIADMYNDTCVSFPRLTVLSEKRKKAIKARLNTYSVEDFQRLFEMAESSSFLKGQNQRNWSATFDWLIADGNMVKVLDGNYNDKKEGETNEKQSSENRRPASAYYEQFLNGGDSCESEWSGIDFSDGPFS